MDDFIHKFLDEYETKFEPIYTKAKTPGELQYHHTDLKSQVLKSIPVKWKETFGPEKELPKNVKQLVTQKIDESFQNLKAYFQADKQTSRGIDLAEKQKCQEEALKGYKKNMETYFKSNSNPTRQDLEAEHQKFLEQAKSQARKSGDKEGNLLTKLCHAIEAHYNEYLEKVKKTEAARPESNIAIGIDLGTTNCCVMVVQNDGKPELIKDKNQGNSRTTPSYVAYHSDGTDTYGTDAKEKAYRFPEITIYDAKRIIGRPWDDANLQKDKESWPFEVVDDNGNPKVKTGDRTRYPHEVSARLLRQFRHMAEQHLNLPSGTIRKAVVTVPAYFTELQRRATNDAATCAGLEVLNILSEPTAASIAYSFERKLGGDRTALIYDLGGGTFDVAIAKISNSDVIILGVDGDAHLGGQDFDNLLLDYCIEEFKKKTGHDLKAGRQSKQKPIKDESLRALSRVKLMCEKAKEQLSSSNSTEVYVERLKGETDMNILITRKILDDLCKPLVQKTVEIVTKAIKDAKSKGINGKEDIDDVILVGGSTRMPLVEQMLGEYFKGKQLCKSINPDEAVAYGAAVQANILSRPKNKSESGKPRLNVQDVLPMSVGVEIIGGEFSPLLKKNQKIPCKFSDLYVTADDYQTCIEIKVFQGEGKMTKENKLLGQFLLDGFPPKPAGEEEVRVTMKISSTGMLHVEAFSTTTKNSNAITITSDRLGMDMLAVEELTKKLENIPAAKPRMVK